MNILKQKLIQRWQGESGYQNVITLAFPLILSTASWSLQTFIDRMFLTWYRPEAIAAAMPAGMLNFMLMSFFIGTAGYVSTFVAQYYGAQQYTRVGPVVWQGTYIAIIAGLGFLGFIPLAEPFFRLVGHTEAVQKYEVIYFQILCYGAVPGIVNSALSSFFSGLGRTWTVMWVNFLGTFVNLLFDYLLIFGKFGFPEWGMAGAAIATILCQYVGMVAYALLLFRPANNRQYHTLKGWRFDRALFLRLLRFGAPSGVQFWIDMTGFTLFILFIGRLGTIELASSNIAFNINTLAFMPMIGIGIAVSVLVGQHLGNNRPDLAERGVYSGFHITLLYMTTIAVFYVLTPQIFLRPYLSQANPADLERMERLVTVLLRFVAVYSLFDGLNIIFSSAIRGAGDTRFTMFTIALVSGGVLVVPSYLTLIVWQHGIYTGWFIASTYVIVLGFTFLGRFLQGKWKTMRVIEEPPPFTPPHLPENPVAEYEL